jgi:hypothetical protein
VTSRESNPDLAQDRDRQTRSDRIVKTSRTKLRHVAGGLIAASVGTGLLAIAVRAGWGGSSARALEGATLFLAAAAYLAHVIAHHDDPRHSLTPRVQARRNADA